MIDAPAKRQLPKPNQFVAIAIVALLARLPFIFLFPATGGDADIYTTVAQNILSGCGVSLSDPANADCIPHFGGNQGPGYPFFIAAIWFLSDHADVAVRVAQAVILSGAIGFATYAFTQLMNSSAAGMGIGLLLALSPLELAWPRYLQTETLSLAAVICFFAALMLSIRRGRLQVVLVGIFLALGTLVRLDLVTLTVPVAVAAFGLHKFRTALVRGGLVAVILAVPWGAWTARNIAVDLPKLLPTPMIVPDGARSPLGYSSWVKTWLVKEYERPGALWGPTRFNYDNIYIPERAYRSPEEKQKVTKLLERLRKFHGRPFPAEIDRAFARLARERRSQDPLQIYVVNPAIRFIGLWSNPFSSFGWPNELPSRALSDEDRLSASQGEIQKLLTLARQYPAHALTKGTTGTYRVLLVLAFIMSCIYAFAVVRDRNLRVLTLSAVSFVVARTLLLAIIGNIETRYTVQAVPAMEIIVMASFWHWWRRRTV